MFEIELNSLREDRKRGRLNFTMSALTIHERGQWNKRGITWLEEYVIANIESAIGMPIVVSWIVDREIPSDHGSYSFDEEGNRYFYDSDTVGFVKNAYISETTVDGITSKKLVCKGYIFKERYPKFCEWMKQNLKENVPIKGSVEIDGKGDSQQIIYESGNGQDENGNLMIGRIPTVFDFTGLAILSDVVRPADNGSEIIELNTLNNESNKGDSEMEKQIEELTAKVEELTSLLTSCQEELDSCKKELNTCKEEKESCTTELNECKATVENTAKELNECKEKENELNSIIVKANKTIESQKTVISELNSEIEPLREMKSKMELEAKQAEINAYFETIKSENGFTADELNSLKEEFVDKCDLEGLKAKEQELCVNKFKEMKKLESLEAELNSHKAKDEDTLFFSTKIVPDVTLDAQKDTDGSELFN